MNIRSFSRTARYSALLLILLSSVLLSAQVTVTTYDFESRTIGAIHGQDNWLYMGNLNNSGNSTASGNCNYTVVPVPTAIAATPTVGLYTGGKGLYNGGTTGNSHGFASRKNNAAWGYSVTSGTDYLVLEFDYDNANYWGELVNLGYDKNGDGDYSSNCRTPDANEIGLGLNISTTLLFFRADGTTVSAPRVGAGWTRYRITVDLRASGGQGAASVCYRELASSGAWQQVPGLQNINMNINPASLNQNNLQNLDGIIVQQEAGGAGTVDNITITTYKNTSLLPVSLCAGNSLSLTGLSIPSVTLYRWNTPAGNTFTTSVAGFSLSNLGAADQGTYTLSVNDCTPLTWTVPVTVNQKPVMTSAGSATICSGGDPNIVFTSTPGASYSWLAADNMNTTGESLAAQTLSVLHNTITSSSAVAETVTYSVTPSSLAGACVGATQTISIRVDPSLVPAVSIAASSPSICAGSSMSFTATPTNGGTAPTYQWLLNGANAGTGSVFSSSALANTDAVSVILNSNAACALPATVNSNTITAIVIPTVVPLVSIAASSPSLCAGSSMSFTATPTNGGTAPVYQWLVNGANAGTGSVFSSSTLANADAVSVILNSNAACAMPATANSNTITAVVIPTVVPAVSIAASSPSICAGSSMSFTATPMNGGSSPAYQWLLNGVNAGTGSVFSSSTLANADAVSVILNSNATCALPATVNSNTITAIVIPTVVPSVSIAASSPSLCAGSSMSFTATPTNGGTSPAYQWLVNGANAGTGSALTSTTLVNHQSVSVILTSHATCALPLTSSSNTITAVVIPTVIPTVSVAVSSQSICAGSSMSFTATPTNGGTAPTYQWLLNGSNAGTGSVFTSTALLNTDVVSVMLSSNATCVVPSTANSNSITAVVIPTVVPTVSVAVSSQSICAGSSMTFTATPANGGTSPAYQWLINGANAGSGAVFSTSALLNNQTVSVRLTSNATCAVPSTANSNTLTAVVIPTVVPTVSVAASSQSICAGSSMNFTATPTNGGTSPTYQWLLNGANVGSGSVFTSTLLTNNQTVSVMLTSNAACALPSMARSNTITAVVIPTVVPMIAAVASSQSICAGSSMSFTATPTNGGTSPAYQWLVNGAPAATGSVFTSTTLVNNQSVLVVLTSNAVCALPSVANSNTITAVVIPAVVPTVSVAASTQSICAGSSLSFTATSTNGGALPAYQWLVNGTNAGNGAVFSSATLANNDAVSVALTSNATCALPSGARSNTISAVVIPTVIPAVTVAASSPSICAGSSMSFTATPTNGGASPAYQWLVNGVNAGTGSVFTSTTLVNNQTVSLVMTSNAVCAFPSNAVSNTLTAVVIPTVVPVVLIAASGSSLCAGASMSFTATPTNGGASPLYQWLVNGAPAGTGSVFSSTALANNDAVSVTMLSDAACAAPAGAMSNTIAAVVIPTVAPSVSIAASAYSICAGSSISFTATPGHEGTSPAYQWFVNGNAAGSGLVFSPVNLKDQDAVSVELSSDAVCAVPATMASAPLVLSVTPLPVASFQYSPDPLTDIDPAIHFQNNSLNATSWSWDFGSGAISDEQHPVYNYPRAGSYVVTLVARNAQCRGVSTQTITVDAVTTYYIPDAFTPNGDGVNDAFGLVGFGLTPDTYEMSIYNRWGDLIFRSSPDTPLWDGNRGGERAEAGVYVYMISFEYKQGKYKEFVNKTGHLTLIR